MDKMETMSSSELAVKVDNRYGDHQIISVKSKDFNLFSPVGDVTLSINGVIHCGSLFRTEQGAHIMRLPPTVKEATAG